MTRLSVSVVVYDTREGVLGSTFDSLLESIEALGGRLTGPVSLYLVMNSEARTVSGVVQRSSSRLASSPLCRVETISGHGNIGYGAGHNLAILRARSDYHLVLNPDVIIAREALVEGLAYLDSHPEAVMVAPQGFDENGDYAYLARRDASICALIMKALPVTRRSGLARRYVYEDRLPSGNPECVCLASGCFMLGRTGCLAQIGGFDEQYFLYFEDYDLSKRIADLGAIVEVPTVRIQHFGGSTLSRGWPRIKHFLKSGWLYFRRWGFQLA